MFCRLRKVKPRWFVFLSLLVLLGVASGTNATYSDQKNGNVQIVVNMPETPEASQEQETPEVPPIVIVTQEQQIVPGGAVITNPPVAPEPENEASVEYPTVVETSQLESLTNPVEENPTAAAEEVVSEASFEGQVLPEISQAQDQTSTEAVS